MQRTQRGRRPQPMASASHGTAHRRRACWRRLCAAIALEVFLATACWLCVPGEVARAQAEPAEAKAVRVEPAEVEDRIFEKDPYDQLTLDPANSNAVLKLFPLDLPGRRLPENPRSSDTLRIRLLDRPDDEFDVSWRHIAKLELFEQLILAEATELVGQEKFISH